MPGCQGQTTPSSSLISTKHSGLSMPNLQEAVYLDNSSAKAYSCYQDNALSLSFRLSCCILYLATKHGTTFIVEYYQPISLWKRIICHEEEWFQNGTFFLT